MASGFKSLNLTTKTSKTLSIANVTALTEKMELVFSDIKDPRVERTRVHLLTFKGITNSKVESPPSASDASDNSIEVYSVY
ncbi:hypothetical protein [Nostoc sp. ChiQUE01b]|uniref:hypothetical protein n=1 Tax=Nostoc sp. ChiQUE01b TaxID=3075376 RepID=UPI002AD2E5A9|nr:hypothetical protein [Nostoc sp. ChiQUE01b]MDZ8259899.1 hypothetical protein [Nostoc sp. ChiQUE01b]